MLKEIFEQPRAWNTPLRGRVDFEHRQRRAGGPEPHPATARRWNASYILSCGTSYYAGLVGKHLFREDLRAIPVEVEYASEFRYRNPI